MNYHRIYNSIVERGLNRIPEGYVERHHIVPRCLGGSDAKSNLVALTPEEHFVAHVLLVKIHPDIDRLVSAVNQMCQGHLGRRRRKLYGWLKRRFIEVQSHRMSGSGNSQAGSFWITDGTQNKKCRGEVPDGWFRGRNRSKPKRACDKCWIHNGLESKLVKKTEPIPDGWIRGRINYNLHPFQDTP